MLLGLGPVTIRISLAAALLAAALPQAVDAETLVKPDLIVSPAGASVTLVFLNETAERLVPPPRIDADMTIGGRTVPVVLTRRDGTEGVPPSAFARMVYDISGAAPEPGATVSLTLPAPWQTAAQLTAVAAPADATNEALAAAPDAGMRDEMATEPAPELAAAPASIATPAAEALAVTTPEETFEERSYFSTYQPVYAVLGLSPANAKLQFSFKYALVDPDGDAAMRWSFLRGVYFGYTQTMFWDLAQESSPFRSIDFKPELFYRYRSDRFLQSLERPALNVQAGIRHQSNGREEPASRSFNETYIEPSVTLPVGGGYHLTAAPRAWFYFGDLEDNPDIDEFRGNTSFRLSLLREDGARLEARAIGFVGTGRGSLQTDASYPITGGFIGNLNLRAHAQLFTGYGDNLLEYDRKVTRLRIGISLAD